MSFPFNEFTKKAIESGKSAEYIKVCTDYAKFLSERSFPVIFSLEHLAILIKIQSNYLRCLIGDKKDNFKLDYNKVYKYRRYHYFNIKKRNGANREIMAPARDLKYIQKWILLNILNQFQLAKSCKGFRQNVSIYDNAKVHEGAKLILKVDLLNFYDSINEKRVFQMFKSFGYIGNLAYSLAKITTAKHQNKYWAELDEISKEKLKVIWKENSSILPQGAPTSPMIANIIATKMDSRFEALGQKMNFKYSRYADDLTFSILNSGKLPPLSLINKIVESEDFFINNEKTKYMKRGCEQYVTGLTVTNGTNVSKKYRKEIHNHIYSCRKYGVTDYLLYKKNEFIGLNNLKFHDWLHGHICFIYSINPEAGIKMFEDFRKIDWFL